MYSNVCVCVYMFENLQGDSNLTKFLKVLPKEGAEESVTCSIGGGLCRPQPHGKNVV